MLLQAFQDSVDKLVSKLGVEEDSELGEEAATLSGKISVLLSTYSPVMNCDMTTLAEQMTWLDHKLLSNLPLTELLQKNYASDQTSPHMLEISDYFNLV